MTKLDLDRRSTLGVMGGVAASLTLPSRLLAQAPPTCGFPRMTESGPYYPIEPIVARQDLTRLHARSAVAKGEVIQITGRVLGPGCAPVAGARVEFWQTDDAGEYDHPRDAREAPRDPNFGYAGQVASDSAGLFWFRTIRPKPYELMGVRRAPHIHFNYRHASFGELTTEMYFPGHEDDAIRARDQVYLGRAPFLKPLLIAERLALLDGVSSDLGLSADQPTYRYDLIFM